MSWISTNLMKIAIALLAIVAVLGFFQLRSCINSNRDAAQSRVDKAQAGAAKQSGGDAVNTVSGVAENQAATEELTRSNEQEIRNAQGAGDPVNAGVRDAGLRSLCRRAATRNDPRCRVQPTPAN